MSQHRKPYRPRTEADVSITFNDGVVKIFSVADVAESGFLPEEELTLKLTLPYQEKKLGVKRYYNAKQNQINVNRVIRVPLPPTRITNQDAAETEDGMRYRIDLVQVMTDTFPPCADLTLIAYRQTAEEAQQNGEEVLDLAD